LKPRHLRPLVFIFVNDVGNVRKDTNPRLFADDTNIFLCSPNLTELKYKAQTVLNDFQKWFYINKLSLNVSKTCYTIFQPRGKTGLNVENFELTLNDQKLEQVSSSKYLGIFIDENLNWKIHIETINNKLTKLCGIFYKIRDLLPFDCAKNLYYALVHPHIIYGLEVYGNTCYTHIEPLVKLNNKIIRILFKVPFRTHVYELYNLCNSLPVNLLHETLLIQFVHKTVYFLSNTPEVFHMYFQNINSQDDYVFRKCNNMIIPRCNTSLGQRNCTFKCAKL